MLRQQFTLGLVLLLVTTSHSAQDDPASLPKVTAADTPIYPVLLHTANIGGTVRLRLRTDGRRVSNVVIESDGGNPALGRAAKENASTWEFSQHEPTSFTVTYHYVLCEQLEDIKSSALNSKVVLKFPTSVEIYARRWPGAVDLAPGAQR
jgi:hypothetical protein